MHSTTAYGKHTRDNGSVLYGILKDDGDFIELFATPPRAVPGQGFCSGISDNFFGLVHHCVRWQSITLEEIQRVWMGDYYDDMPPVYKTMDLIALRAKFSLDGEPWDFE